MIYYTRIFRHPTFVNRTTGKVMPNDTKWQDRHLAAIQAPSGFESAIVGMIDAWATYADKHRMRYDSGIGADHVLGDSWMEIGRGIRALLNGETGRLDCGTLDGFICETLNAEGFPQ